MQSQGRRFSYAGIFLVALATLMLEILLTRITSVIAWYHLAFFVIAVAAAEAAVGLAIVLAFFRVRKTIHSDEANLLKN